MKKITAITIIAMILILAACNTDEPTESVAPTVDQQETFEPTGEPVEPETVVSDYFPFTENVHMKYRGDGNEFAEFETYVEYINSGAMQMRTLNPGTVSASVYLIEDGCLKKVYSSEETYFRYDFTGLRETEDILIKEPVEVGTLWKAPDGSDCSITALNARVEVPYGTFDALEVTTENEYSTVKNYYAEGIGLIKREFTSKEDQSIVVSSDLEELEKDVPFVQNLRFYYPDFNNERIVYIEDAVDLFTGDDVIDVFNTQMSKVPEGSSISPIMSENTSLLSMNFDRQTSIANVDFSSEFISEMNTGSSLEAMILTCVANTFGSYYTAEKVAITIEGADYESGHFYFGINDYLTPDYENTSPYVSEAFACWSYNGSSY